MNTSPNRQNRASNMKLHIEGIKSINKVCIDPRQLTFIMGPNDSGKTNICLSLSLLSDILLHGAMKISTLRIGEGGYRFKYGPWKALYCRFSGTPIRYKLIASINSNSVEYTLKIHPENASIENEIVSINNTQLLNRFDSEIQKDGEAAVTPAVNPDMPLISSLHPKTTDKSKQPPWSEPLNTLRSILNHIIYIDLQYNDLLRGARESNSKSDFNLESCGGDIAGLVGYLFDRGTDMVSSFQEEIEKLFGITIRIRTEQGIRTITASNSVRPEQEIFSYQLAHGTLKAIYLSALKHLRPRNCILLIDELENGLNPKLMNWALSTLNDIAGSGNHVIVTTHSLTFANLPSFFDAMKAGDADVLLTKREKNGPTEVKAVSDIIRDKFGESADKFWDEVPVSIGELIETDYFDF